MNATPLLSVRGLNTRFATDAGVLRAVDGVDLDVWPGESLGVVGESGSGKSVTFLSVLGLVRPPGVVQAESIRFDGREIGGLPQAALRQLRGRELALTLQDALTALNPALTIGTQIAETLAAHEPALTARERGRRAEELLRLVGIPDAARRLRAYPHEFSGGMRQRAMIAIALACKPKLLIADEPTTALDVTVQAQVLELMAELRARLGMSLVLISHDLGVIAEYCERIAVMYAGQVVETGPARAVIDSPLHPYTAGLLASLPRLDEPDAPLTPIRGQMPDAAHLPPGCRFAARCPRRAAPCTEPQSMRAVASGGAVATPHPDPPPQGGRERLVRCARA
jgi:oligopeptide/dipeptide ABC transporter ATP-binding protein